MSMEANGGLSIRLEIDSEVLLKSWAQASHSKSTKRLKGRERGLMRSNRLCFKTLKWSLKKLMLRSGLKASPLRNVDL